MSALAHHIRRSGYAHLPGALPPEMAESLSAECDRLWGLEEVLRPDNLRTLVLGDDHPIDRLDPVIDLSPVLRDLSAHRAVLTPVAAVVGEGPRLFKDKLIFKPPGARGYDAHQDYAYWQWLDADPGDLVTVMVCIDDAGASNGGVEFFGGSYPLLTPAGTLADVDEADLAGPGEVLETAPGDLVVFTSLVPHRSGRNRSSTTRRQLYLSYNRARCGDLYSRYYAQLHVALRARAPHGDSLVFI